MREKSLLTRVCAWLDDRMIWYQNNTKAAQDCAGLPDLLIVVGGHALYLELKQEGKRPRPIQKYRQSIIRQSGATVATVDSFDDAIQKVKDVQILQGDPPVN